MTTTGHTPTSNIRAMITGYEELEDYADNTIGEKPKIDQTKKTKNERQENVQNIFDIKYDESDGGKHYLLIDDVITSGATLELCAKAMLKIPNSKISIITIAYTQS